MVLPLESILNTKEGDGVADDLTNSSVLISHDAPHDAVFSVQPLFDGVCQRN